MDKSKESKYLDILQIFRGIAALMVVVHHSSGSLKYYHKIDSHFLEFIGSLGKYGVDFFFVLSGFIITYTAYFKYGDPNSFKSYVKNRLIRIYVPYLPIGIFFLVLYTLFPGFSNSGRDISVLTSLTLIPYGNPALSVAWTLSFELCFYLLFSISFFSKKMWNIFVCVWLCLILMVNYGTITFNFKEHPILRIIFSTYNFEFIFGFFLAKLVLKKIKFNLILLFCFLLLLSGMFFYFKFIDSDVFYFSMNLLFSLISFFVIYISIIYFNKKINPTNVLMMVGNATYSIYLVHNPLQMILIRIYPKINSTLNLIFALFLAIFISCLIGYIYYLIFEKKAINSLRNRF
jgi:exopolysaccharide production protein ExoZ